MNINGVAAEFVDIKPERQKNAVPILFVGGLGTPIADYQEAMRGLYESGRRVIALNHKRAPGASVLTSIQSKITEKIRVPSESAREAQSILEVLDLRNIHEVDVLAHSAGALNATVMALWQPYKVRNIIFLNPPGIGNESFLEQAKGMWRHLGESGITLDKLWERVKPRLVNTIAKSISVTGADITWAFRRLHEKGIGIMIGISKDDPIFKAERMTLAMSDKLGDIDGFFIMPGGHHPSKRMDEIEALFDQLEEDKRRHAQEHADAARERIGSSIMPS